jgi:hypothetical protein
MLKTGLPGKKVSDLTCALKITGENLRPVTASNTSN